MFSIQPFVKKANLGQIFVGMILFRPIELNINILWFQQIFSKAKMEKKGISTFALLFLIHDLPHCCPWHPGAEGKGKRNRPGQPGTAKPDY
jgi:hypothetical protein